MDLITSASNKNVKHVDMLVFTGFGIHSALKGILLPMIKASFDISYTQSGLLLTATTLGFFLAAMISGKASEKLGQLKLLALYAFLLTASAFTVAAAPVIEYVVAAFFVSGMCYGGIESVSTPLLKRFYAGEEDRVINAVFAFYMAGGLIAALFGFVVVTYGIDWRWCYITVGAVCALAGLAAVRLSDSRQAVSTQPIDLSQLKTLGHNRTFLLLCLASALFSGVETSAHNWLATFMSDGAHLGAGASCILLAMFFLSICMGRAICGKLLLRHDAKNICQVLVPLSGVVLIGISFMTSPPLIWVSTAMFGLASSGLYPMLASVTSGAAKESMAYTATFVSISLGNITANALLGLIADQFGVRSTFRFDSILLFAVAAILFIVIKGGRDTDGKSVDI